MKFSRMMKRAAALALTTLLLLPVRAADVPDEVADAAEVDAAVFAESVPAAAEGLSVAAPSAILMEKETGEVLWEKNADERLKPASVTKVMTILLLVEAVESGAITLDDDVTVSANAAGMGGSQVFLSEGEHMKAGELLKCIVVSSANDAAVAMAEYTAGTEEAFVARMNARAAELGMTNTTFTNCTGLFDDDAHRTTARDIAVMSRELIRHAWIKEYTTIWMDTIRGGQFGLSNTNKLIYYYDGATGLKTGFTSSAGYCLAATAERNGVEFIAAVMHCDTSAERFESAKTLLSYGFANYTLVPAAPEEALPPIPVALGTERYVQPVPAEERSVLVEKAAAQELVKRVELAESLTAPVATGQVVGRLTIARGEEIVARTDIVAADEVARVSWWTLFTRMTALFFLGG